MEDNKMSEETSQSVSRRNFIKGVIAAGTVASTSAYLFRTTTMHGQSAAGAVERLITLNVNGQERRIDVMPQETLAMALRYKAGPHRNEDRMRSRGVRRLHRPRRRCAALLVLGPRAHGARARRSSRSKASPIRRPASCSPVQQGVVDEQGFQCAFCMPGFVMAATGYLKTNPNPTRQELAHGVSGNLCRCQDYDKILTALMRGAEYARKA